MDFKCAIFSDMLASCYSAPESSPIDTSGTLAFMHLIVQFL